MKRFSHGQRVHVMRTSNDIEVEATGTVVRLRMADNDAWIALDKRSDVSGAHPFPADDERSTHVVAYPDDCAEVSR